MAETNIGGSATGPVHGSVSVGDVIAGKFRVDRIIGEGGMAVVVEALHLQLDERVALKLLKPTAVTQPDIVRRFSQEARAVAKLKSEHVARVLDVGTLDDGTPYIVMEYLVGRDLARVIVESGPVPIVEAVDYVIQACEALAEAHARGVVHRDIKPENIFLVEREDGWGTVKILDFGISKVALTGNPGDSEVASRRTTAILGTPYYMSPEQLRSTRSVDHRADVWSLGAVLFEILTGHTAFESVEFLALVDEIRDRSHRSLRDLCPSAPEALERVVDQCLAKDPKDRFPSMAELAVALLPYASTRAQVVAEKTVSIVRTAGMLSDPNLKVSASLQPPSSADIPKSTSASTIGGLARSYPNSVASFREPVGAAAFQPSLDVVTRAEAATMAPPATSGRTRWLVLAAALAVMATFFVVLSLRDRATVGPVRAAGAVTALAALPPDSAADRKGEEGKALSAADGAAASPPAAPRPATPAGRSDRGADGRATPAATGKRTVGAPAAPLPSPPAAHAGDGPEDDIRHER